MDGKSDIQLALVGPTGHVMVSCARPYVGLRRGLFPLRSIAQSLDFFASNHPSIASVASVCPHPLGFHPALSGARASDAFLTRATASPRTCLGEGCGPFPGLRECPDFCPRLDHCSRPGHAGPIRPDASKMAQVCAALQPCFLRRNLMCWPRGSG